MLLSKDDELQSTSKLLKDKVCIMYNELYVYGTVDICLLYVYVHIHTILPQIMAWAFISFQRFLPRLLNKTHVYYWKKHVLFIICDASDEF